LLHDDTKVEDFTAFVESNEVGLRGALTAALGGEVGREAAAEALAYGWEHWGRVSLMVNPVGYLYTVGRSKGTRIRKRKQRFVLPASDVTGQPWVEPGLPDAIARLPERQRVVVWLLHSEEWTMSGVADLLGITKASVQKHAERGMRTLRRELGVET
jgi:DNA-directed RNA polymerase specialized sigma24 family protein